MKKNLKSLLALCGVFLIGSTTMGTAAQAAVSTTVSGSVLYNIPYDTSAGTETDIAKYANQFVVTDKTGNVFRTGDTSRDAYAKIDSPNMKALSLEQSVRLKKAATINAVFELPALAANYKRIIPTATAEPQIELKGISAENLDIKYSMSPGNYTTRDEFIKNSGNDWHKLLAVFIISKPNVTVPAGASVKMAESLTLPAITDDDINAGHPSSAFAGIMDLSNNGSGINLGSDINFSKRLDYQRSRYQAVKVLNNSQGNVTYQAYANDVQSVLPAMAEGSYHFRNVFSGMQSKMNEDQLFNDGIIMLDLTKVKQQINNQGLSVALGKDGNQLTQQKYGTVKQMETINLVDGNDNTIQNSPDQQYIEIHQVIKAKDFSLEKGADWNAAKMTGLISAISPVDDKTNISNRIMVNGQVDTTTAGTYPIMYTYQVGKDTISKQVNVTVKADPMTQDGQVVVHYQDEKGKAISADTILSGKVGQNYTTKQKQINGYSLKEVKGQKSGQYTNKQQDVTYVYSQKVADPNKDKNEHTNQTTDKNINPKGQNRSGKLPQTGLKNTRASQIAGIILIVVLGAFYMVKFKRIER